MILLLFSIISVSSANQAASTPFSPQGQCEQVLDYEYYSLCYSSEHRQALWTFHLLTKKSIQGKQGRTNDFRRDDRALDSVGSREYKGSGYDRGHMVPAGDMKLSRMAMSESFYMTNMSPQNPSFNRGIWKSLESRVRSHVARWGEAYVVTAPVLEAGLRRIWSDVSIPSWYYKIAYYPDKQLIVAHLLPNQRREEGKKLEDYKVSVDELEALTGIDFFAELPDELEEELEAVAVTF